MMEFVAAYQPLAAVRPTAFLIEAAKIEARCILRFERWTIDNGEHENKLRTLLIEQWRAARAGNLQPDYFYSTARSMAETLARLILIRRTRRFTARAEAA